MEYLYRPAPFSYKDTEYQEEDPEKMYENHTIRCYPVKHFYLTLLMKLNNADVVKKFIFRYLDLPLPNNLWNILVNITNKDIPNKSSS